MSKIKFTCASAKDNGKVTVTTNQLENNQFSDGVPALLLIRESRIIATISYGRRTYEVLFAPNRFPNGVAVTAATNAWPKALRTPKVGKPVFYNVVGVTYV
jgi:hypothetical protein